MIQGILKPMPEYGVHYRAGVEFTSRGREFIVDDTAVEKENAKIEEGLGKRAELLTTPRDKLTDAQRAEIKDLSANEIESEIEDLKRRRAKIKAGLVDETGRPLLFSSKCYKYFELAIGHQLVLEHWDGKDRPPEVKAMTVDERLTLLEGKFNELIAALRTTKK